MMTSAKMRLTLGTADVAQSVGFYRLLFGAEPTSLAPTAARFDLADPPLVLSLERRERRTIKPVGSPGLRLPDRAAVVAVRDRLTRAGLRTHTQECTHCGYNEQFRVHIADPDGNYWFLYAVDRLIHPSAIHRCLEGPEAILSPDPVERSWDDNGKPPNRIPHADCELDEVRLTDGSLAAEAWRVLRPGGILRVRSSEATATMETLHTAGFRGIEATDETVIGTKPTDRGQDRLVIYKGPFRVARDDLGNVYPRGRRVTIGDDAWTLLRRGTSAEQFLFLFPFGYPAAGPVRSPEEVP